MASPWTRPGRHGGTREPDSGGGDRQRPWGGRFATAQEPLFERLNASIPFDHVLAPFDIEGSRAHVRMLGGHRGADAPRSGTRSSAGSATVARRGGRGAFRWYLHDEDVHMAIERRLTELVGPVGGKVHTGRSRNDQVALDLQLYLRDAVAGHLDRIATSWRPCSPQAEKHADVVLPGYTHLQRAQPVLLAHHLLAYFFAASERTGSASPRWSDTSWMPLGAGALGGRQLPARPGDGGRASWASLEWRPTPWTRSPPATRPSRIWRSRRTAR